MMRALYLLADEDENRAMLGVDPIDPLLYQSQWHFTILGDRPEIHDLPLSIVFALKYKDFLPPKFVKRLKKAKKNMRLALFGLFEEDINEVKEEKRNKSSFNSRHYSFKH